MMEQRTHMPAEDFFLLFGSMLENRRAAIRSRCTMAFAVVDSGAYFVDTGAKKMVERKWTRDATITVLCNQRTLSDWIAGRFDMKNPAPEHLFVWGGDRKTWETLMAAFSGGTSTFGAQIASLLSTKGKKR